MNQYNPFENSHHKISKNPFENSHHKISKNPFEHKNISSDMFEPTSNNHLESWDTYKKSEKQVKKYTNKQVIKEKDLNTVNNNKSSINLPNINIPKNIPNIGRSTNTRSGRLKLVIIVFILLVFLSGLVSFIETAFDNYVDEYDNYEYELEAKDKTCLNAIEGIKNNTFHDFNVSEIQKSIETNNIDLNEIIDKITNYGTDSIYIPYENYEDKDLDHIIEYKYISEWDENDNYIYNIFIFYLEGENINDYDSSVSGKILGIELIRSYDYECTEVIETIKCGNCEYNGKSLEYYLHD